MPPRRPIRIQLNTDVWVSPEQEVRSILPTWLPLDTRHSLNALFKMLHSPGLSASLWRLLSIHSQLTVLLSVIGQHKTPWRLHPSHGLRALIGYSPTLLPNQSHVHSSMPMQSPCSTSMWEEFRLPQCWLTEAVERLHSYLPPFPARIVLEQSEPMGDVHTRHLTASHRKTLHFLFSF